MYNLVFEIMNSVLQNTDTHNDMFTAHVYIHTVQ